MEIINYIPLSAALVDVYQTIDPNFVDEAEITEWASKAMQRLSVKQTYEVDVCFAPVENHKAWLPMGIKYIDQIFYKDSVDPVELDKIKVLLSTPESDTDLIVTIYTELGRDLRWKPLRESSSTFHKLNNTNVPQGIIYAAPENQFSVNKNGSITTTMQKGYVCIGYYRYPMRDGEFLIPDEETVLNAMKNYILMRVWEKRMNYKEDGAQGMFILYRDQWQATKDSATGKLLLKNIDGLENLKQQTARFGVHGQSYYDGFGLLSSGENMIF